MDNEFPSENKSAWQVFSMIELIRSQSTTYREFWTTIDTYTTSFSIHATLNGSLKTRYIPYTWGK